MEVQGGAFQKQPANLRYLSRSFNNHLQNLSSSLDNIQIQLIIIVESTTLNVFRIKKN